MNLFTYIASTLVRSINQNMRFNFILNLILIVCVCFLALSQITTAETVHIPDPGLRAALELALDKDAGEDITQARYGEFGSAAR